MSRHKINRIFICKSCKKEKKHEGLQMCSACLRNYKRKTKPTFYLGTCYSEISRRVKTWDPLRPNYYGKEKCTRDEFINRFKNDKAFLKLYKNWQKNNYLRKYAPSIDRIDNSKGYSLDNMQFISHAENTGKDSGLITILENDNEKIIFRSLKAAAKFLGTYDRIIFEHKKLNKEFKGYKIYEP